MPTPGLTRRAALAAPMTLAVVAASQRPCPRPPFGPGIRVDVGRFAPMRAIRPRPGSSNIFLARSPEASLRGGARANVSVRIDYLTLGSNTGGYGPAGSSYDNIQGVATIDGVERPVRATSSYYPSPVDQTMIEQSNRERVRLLTQALAFWIAQDAAR